MLISFPFTIRFKSFQKTTMPAVRYEQLSTKLDAEEDNEKLDPIDQEKSNESCIQKSFLSLAPILLYFSLSIGLTFYQRWLLKDFPYPLTVVLYHLVIKWTLAVIIRCILHIITGQSQLVLPFMTCLKMVSPTGLASGIDVGYSNWGLGLVNISLYTMTKSTTIIFILGFAIILGLEKMSRSLVGIVTMISAGLIMFTYKATQFNLLGFILLLIASFASGLRWTFAQLVMQKSKLGLHNPIDMVFHVQPWMSLSLLPFMIGFEGLTCFEKLRSLADGELFPKILQISVGATIAFAMEVSEFLVVTYTSSLTLSIAGIFKEMVVLVLAVEVGGDQLSAVNGVGLVLCLLGITGHVIHKLILIRSVSSSRLTEKIEDDFQDIHRSPIRQGSAGEHHEPLLEDKSEGWSAGEDSDIDANKVLFEVIQRRDNAR